MVAGLSVSAGADVAEHAVAAGERGREPVAHLEGLGLERGHESGELVLAVAQPRLMGGGLGVAARAAAIAAGVGGTRRARRRTRRLSLGVAHALEHLVDRRLRERDVQLHHQGVCLLYTSDAADEEDSVDL